MKYISLICTTAILWAGPTSQYLANFDQPARENAVIQLESSGAPTEDMRYADDLWNAGRYDDALSLIEQIEEENGAIAVAINYRNPVITQNFRWSDDVKVNTGYNYNHSIELIHADNGNLFIVALSDSFWGEHYSWNVYMSTDGGYTWARTAHFNAVTDSLYDVDAAEMPGYVYVAYAISSAPTTGRLRRVFETTGAIDTGFGLVNAFTVTGNINDVNLEPSRVYWSEMYYGAICDINVLHYFYASDPISWTGIATGVNNAERGLDMDYGFISGASHYLWISYINTYDSLCARARVSGSWGVHDALFNVNTLPYHGTAIAHHGDTVLIVFEDTDFHCRYHVTYNDGMSWSYGYIDEDSSASADVTGRGNEGWHVSWAKYYGAAPEDVYYRTGTYAIGTWPTPELLSEYDQWIQYRTSIDYLGSAGAYGVAYIDDNYDIYFDRLDWVAVAEHTPAENISQFVRLVPNPSRDHVTLSFALSTEGVVEISIFDVTGRMVKSLLNETLPVGKHTLTINNKDLAAGAYFLRIETADHAVTEKMTIIR